MYVLFKPSSFWMCNQGANGASTTSIEREKARGAAKETVCWEQGNGGNGVAANEGYEVIRIQAGCEDVFVAREAQE